MEWFGADVGGFDNEIFLGYWPTRSSRSNSSRAIRRGSV